MSSVINVYPVFADDKKNAGIKAVAKLSEGVEVTDWALERHAGYRALQMEMMDSTYQTEPYPIKLQQKVRLFFHINALEFDDMVAESDLWLVAENLFQNELHIPAAIERVIADGIGGMTPAIETMIKEHGKCDYGGRFSTDKAEERAAAVKMLGLCLWAPKTDIEALVDTGVIKGVYWC